MDKVNKCFKVVSIAPQQLSEYRSFILFSSHSLIYRLGEVTKAITGKLFVFKSLADAIDFYYSHHSGCVNAILECECSEDLVPISYVGSISNVGHFWKWIESGQPTDLSMYAWRAPQGSYIASWVKPISVVDSGCFEVTFETAWENNLVARSKPIPEEDNK